MKEQRGSLDSEEYYITAHKSKFIDYMTFHLWVKNWSWYDAKRKDETYNSAKEKAVAYINKHIEFAKEIGKPITLEEFGIARDLEDYSLLQKLQQEMITSIQFLH